MPYVFDDGTIRNTAFNLGAVTTSVISASFDGTPGQKYAEESGFGAIAQFKGNAVLSPDELLNNESTTLYCPGEEKSYLFFPKNEIYGFANEDDFEISAKLIMTGREGEHRVFYSQMRQQKGFYFKVSQNNRLSFEVLVKNYVRVMGTTRLSLDTVYEVKAIKKGQVITTYLDGIEEGTRTERWRLNPSFRPTIGKSQHEGNDFFQGYLSELVVKKTVISPQL